MPQGGGFASFLMLLLPLLLLVWLFTSQRRRARTMMDFQQSLAVGQEVVTTSGLYGRVAALDDATVTLEIAPGVAARYDRRAIGMAAPSATAAPEQAGEA